MTEEEFFTELEEATKDWPLEINLYNDKLIRQKCTGFCPISVVAKKHELFTETNPYLANREYNSFGKQLGLDRSFINLILDAADGEEWWHSKQVKEIRTKLLTIAEKNKNEPLPQSVAHKLKPQSMQISP